MTTLALDVNKTSGSNPSSTSTDFESTTTSTEAILVIHPRTGQLVEIDPDQWWFWTSDWQAGEREVDEELRRGEYEDFDSIDDFIASL